MNKISFWRWGLVLSLSCFLLTSLLIQLESINELDQRLSDWLQGFESPALTKFFIGITHLASWQAILFVLVLILLILSRKGTWLDMISLSLLTAITPLLNLALKILFARQRPAFHRLIDVSGYSFPSGHTMAAFSLYAGILLLLSPKIASATLRICLQVWSSLMILMIALSRIYLGVHYPTDIIGGLFASASLLSILALIIQTASLARHQGIDP